MLSSLGYSFYSSQSGHELEATIARDWNANATRAKISLSDLAAFPPFLRFDEIELRFLDPDSSFLDSDGEMEFPDTTPIGESCQLFESQLPSIKPTLDDSILTIYCGVYETKPSRFRNNAELIDFLRNRLLTICDNSHGYDFYILLKSDMRAAEYISSILQMPQIDQCSYVTIFLYFDSDQQIRLPVETISKWINRKWTKKGWRKLLIDCDGGEVWNCVNIVEMLNHLKEVFYFLKLL